MTTRRRILSALIISALAAFTGCRGDYSVKVDSTLSPSQPDVPGFVPGERRPLAVFATESGQRLQFIENELVLYGVSEEARNALIERTGATVVRELTEATHGLTGAGDLVLIRVDPARLTSADVEEDLAALAKTQKRHALGHFRISSEAGLRTLAVAAKEARAGAKVALNVQGEATAVPDYTVEALDRPAGVARDAYAWPHLMGGTTLDYDVTGAWSLLYRAAKLGFRIKIAIIDGGFTGGPDTRAPAGYSVTTSGVPPFNTENPNSCTGGSACPWHGQNVLSVCCALVDDGFGGAGTAGLIAEPITVHMAIETFTIAESMLLARSAGARIVNASLSMRLPDIVEWVAGPIDFAVAMLRTNGTLVFAAAGNEGANVDSHDLCFADYCWEDTYYAPCESPGAICVGGMSDHVARATNSNHGEEQVRIYGPYTVLTGPDPVNGGNSVRWVNGTSGSTPYVAGVAALIWAADPEMSADDVAGRLLSYVHSGPDYMEDLRWVSARSAVLGVLGATGSAEIVTPADGASVEWGLPMNLSARILLETWRYGSATCALRWTTDRSGTIFQRVVTMPPSRIDMPAELVVNDTAPASVLMAGSQTLNLEATCFTDFTRITLNDRHFLVVHNTPPVVSIESPPANATSCLGQAVLLRGNATDVNEPTGLESSAYEWRSSLDGFLGVGPARTTSTLRVGMHTLTLTVTDKGGLASQATTTITVRGLAHPDCSNTPPTAQITSPSDGAWFAVTGREPGGGEWYREVDFAGEASDRETPTGSLQLRWTSDVDGVLGTGNTVHARLHTTRGATTTHTITLQVTDGDGNVSTDHIHVTLEVIY